ncbi:MAG: hypothetical protein JXI33_08350 [Candidatus Aminicenantes bacterium]|nr:hypothetical protein [Candidatus Aminicenantes bacterium]
MKLNASRKIAACFAMLLLAALLALPALAGDCSSVREKYEGKTFALQHNLRFDDDEARWVNFIGAADYLDVGTKVTVTQFKPNEISLTAEVKGMTIKLDLKKATPSCAMILEHLLGPSAPSLKGFSATDLKGIKEGKMVIGMSRRALFIAVGYPPYSYKPPFRADSAVNHDPQSNELTYMKGTWDFVTVKLQNNKVIAIED